MTKHDSSVLRNGRHTSPLVLTGVSLVVNALLDYVLVRRVVRVQHLDCLPPALALGGIGALNGETGKQRGQCATLSIHTRLHKLLRAAEVAVAVDKGPGAGHGGDPEAKEERVAILRGPFFGALKCGLVLFEEGGAVPLALDFGLLLGVVLDVEACGGAIGGDDGCVASVLQ